VELKRRAGPLQGDVVRRELEEIVAGDSHGEWASSQALYALGECGVPLSRRQRRRAEVALLERRKDADGNDTGRICRGGTADRRNDVFDLGEERREWPSLDVPRVGVDLDVEAVDFERDAPISGCLDHRTIDRTRPRVAVDEMKLELRAYRGLTSPEAWAIEHGCERLDVLSKALVELSVVLRLERRTIDLYAHWSRFSGYALRDERVVPLLCDEGRTRGVRMNAVGGVHRTR
jgi:hypothetical protein